MANKKTDDKLAGKENIGWNREAQNGKGQGMKSKNEDANVLRGRRKKIRKNLSESESGGNNGRRERIQT